MPGVLTLTATGYRRAVAFVWAAVAGATSYRLQIGTTEGASDVYDVNVNNVLTKTVPLGYGTYYARAVPYTGAEAGEATADQTVTV